MKLYKNITLSLSLYARETSFVTAREEQESEGAESKARGEYLDPRKMKWQEDKSNYLVRNVTKYY
jgi:hypothetical protein